MNLPSDRKAGSIIHQVLEVREESHRMEGFRFGELNPVGQLLFIAVSGRAELDLNGVHYPLQPGTIAWLREAEWLRVAIFKAPWTCLRVRFTAGALPFVDSENRVKHLGTKHLYTARELLSAWTSPNSAARSLLVHGLLSQLVGRLLLDSRAVVARPGDTASPWWRVETEVRRNLARTYTLAELCTMAGTNRVNLELAARDATGLTPIRRVRQMRLMHAQTLMRNSNLLLKEVAVAAGYTRLHEFSRDYRRLFGLSPHKHRTLGYPDRTGT